VRGVLGVIGAFRTPWAGGVGKANRTGENPLSGIAGRPGETWLMAGLGTQPASESAVLVTPA
jgi:hypothetical protein